MGYSSSSSLHSTFPLMMSNSKALALESSLQQSIVNFTELLSDFEQLQVECDKYKLELVNLKDKHDSLNSNEADVLKKAIAAKDQILQSVASSLTKLNDTKDWKVLAEIFKILFNDAPHVPISPTYTENKKSPKTNLKKDTSPKLSLKKDQFKSNSKHQSENTKASNSLSINQSERVKVKESESSEDLSITEDVSFKEESVCEIDGTPTGRISPIIPMKKTKSLLAKSDCRDKKKCPDDWPSPNSKMFKSTPTRGKSVRLRQTRFNFTKLKQSSVVDLTCSPEAGRAKPGLFDGENVMLLIKKESMENDDTILPSPTSGPTSFNLLQTLSKDSPSKFKKPASSLKVKSEVCENEPKRDENRNVTKNVDLQIEDSINILNQRPVRLRFEIKKEKEIDNQGKSEGGIDVDATHCETDSSISVLGRITARDHNCSPSKRPLAENINVVNTPPKCEPEASSSNLAHKMAPLDNVKRKLLELQEPIYKEPTVRNKLEKKNLQGWSCEMCKNFYGELYKDDPVMLAKKIEECSKHRGRHNPERPKTPPNFWKPRWHVPEDTEELNRMNNAI